MIGSLQRSKGQKRGWTCKAIEYFVYFFDLYHLLPFFLWITCQKGRRNKTTDLIHLSWVESLKSGVEVKIWVTLRFDINSKDPSWILITPNSCTIFQTLQVKWKPTIKLLLLSLKISFPETALGTSLYSEMTFEFSNIL